MYLDSKDLIANYPSLKVRDFLKKWEERYSWVNIINTCRMMKIPIKSAQPFLNTLSKLDYIKSTKKNQWELTDKGIRLSQAKGTRIKRETANKIVEQLLQKINEVNQIESCKYYILCVFVFGSYIRDCPYIGDIDIAMDVWSKDEPLDTVPTLESNKSKLMRINKPKNKSEIDPWINTLRHKSQISSFINCHRNIEFHDLHDFLLCAQEFDFLYIDKRVDKEKFIALVKKRQKEYIKDTEAGKTIIIA